MTLTPARSDILRSAGALGRDAAAARGRGGRVTEAPERNLALELVRATEAAALAAARWVGRGDKESGDRAAVEAMRLVLGTAELDGRVAIGEGAKDEAPMLYRGEKVGSGRGPRVDVAVDPVEGTNLLARGQPEALAVIAAAPRGTMWDAGPAFYMDKLVVSRDARDAIRPDLLDAPATARLAAVAAALGRSVADLTVFILDKPRHTDLVAEVRAAGARVLLRTDGDVAGALIAARGGAGVDLLLGIGGTPEGVISACAVRALGGAMLGRLAPQSERERAAVRQAGLDVDRVLCETDLVASEDVFFAATGITDGVLLPGVRYDSDGPSTSSLLMRGKTRTVRTVYAEHRWTRLNELSAFPY